MSACTLLAAVLFAAALGCARTSPALAPPVSSSSTLDEMLRGDLAADAAFPWSAARRLIWSDFQAQPPAGGREGAKTAYALFYAWRCRGTTFEFRAVAAFRPKQSWVKATIVHDSAESRRALGHEQTHFDLAEVHARRMRARFRDLADPCRRTDAELTTLVQGLLQEEKADQHRYDAETSHGLLPTQQAAWRRDVSRRLAAPR